jgi:hypothetical protein
MDNSQNPLGSQPQPGQPVKSGGGVSFRRIFAGLVCGAFFLYAGISWTDSVIAGIVMAIVAFLIGYASGSFVY